MVKITKKEWIGRIQLLIATLIWGTSFMIVKTAQEVISPFYLMAFRFTFASILLCMMFYKRLKFIDWGYVWRGAVMGVCLFTAFGFQMLGLQTLSPGTNAFLTSSYCVFNPFLFWIVCKKKPTIASILSCFVCMVGIGLISITENATIEIGAILSIAGGLFYSAQMVSASAYITKRDPLLLSILQFSFAALCSWIIAIPTSSFPTHIETGIVLQIIYLAVFCTAVSFTLQSFGQKVVSPTATGIIVSFEAVFALIFSAIFYGENLTWQTLIGFIVMFGAIIISEVTPQLSRKKK